MYRFLFFLLFSTSSIWSSFILKDEVGLNPQFHQQVEEMGAELYQKSGIGVYMLILATTHGESLSIVGKRELEQLPKKSVLLSFAEQEKKVDILASSDEVYRLFDKEQILSPFPWSGTILPILGEKVKGDVRKKYSVALFNGYADIVEQIAENSNIQLEHAVGNANKYVINTLRLIFYSVIVLALGYILYRRFRGAKKDV
ncbi:MAG TPA: 3-dehydroquinate dehydratase [Campylobacterales bacterium]|nr:3-dehydroquinate dehydratase [Campylobacterales bacterium]HIO71206.1 3-dehydroquinate dehydratase [Campylobacterales bacterium]